MWTQCSTHMLCSISHDCWVKWTTSREQVRQFAHWSCRNVIWSSSKKRDVGPSRNRPTSKDCFFNWSNRYTIRNKLLHLMRRKCTGPMGLGSGRSCNRAYCHAWRGWFRTMGFFLFYFVDTKYYFDIMWNRKIIFNFCLIRWKTIIEDTPTSFARHIGGLFVQLVHHLMFQTSIGNRS